MNNPFGPRTFSENSSLASPFEPGDEGPLGRFVDWMMGNGFAMAVVLGERPNGLEEVSQWMEQRCALLQAKLLKVNLAHFKLDNPWLELRDAVGQIGPTERRALLLFGVDPLGELSSDGDVPLFRQLNVQRDLFTHDFPCFWMLYLPTRLEHRLKMQAPDFCDFVGYWCGIRQAEEVPDQPQERVGLPHSTVSEFAFAEDAFLRDALGDESLVAALVSTWNWNLDEARGKFAEYELSSNKSGFPGAREFVRGCMQRTEGEILEAEKSFGEANRLGDASHNSRLKLELLLELGSLYKATGRPNEAMSLFREALRLAEELRYERGKARANGRIANILHSWGQVDEAVRIRREEELPVYERFGDVRLKAVTAGKIADILRARGQLDESLRIRREEELPVFERLGDVRSKAVTMGKIADILQDRGQLDEALRIRREEELPVYERLGDVRSKAVTMGKIADILQARGQLDEALRIRREEELPVFERLGDVRSKAVTMGKIADILQDRGQFDEALRIRREEELPVYERLGDVRSMLICRTNKAILLSQRNKGNDREDALEDLRWALEQARRLQLAEIPILEQWLKKIKNQAGSN